MDQQLILKSGDYKKLALRIGKLWHKLDSSRLTSAKDGYIRDQWGTYVPEILANELIEVLKQLIAVNDKNEARANRYSLVGFLLTLNRLDEAEIEVKELIKENSDEPAFNQQLAVIWARRGNFEKAQRFAAMANTSSHVMFHVSPELIREEFEKYRN
jgi:tetratricopeptide (TPR) repeat protein